MTVPRTAEFHDTLRERREARAGTVARRVELIDNAIDLCDALDKAFDRLNAPGADRDVIADGRATLRSMYGALERVRGLDL